MSKFIKTATGLTGLPVAKVPHHTLSALYGKIMRTLAKIPKEAAYRQYTEKIIQQRLKAVEQHLNISDLERAIGCGQVEELIIQAENELQLARKMISWKPWESLIQVAPEKQWDWPPAKNTEPKV